MGDPVLHVEFKKIIVTLLGEYIEVISYSFKKPISWNFFHIWHTPMKLKMYSFNNVVWRWECTYAILVAL